MNLILERPVNALVLEIPAPVSGECMPLQQVPQAVYQLGLFGPGVAIRPSSQRLYAPASCRVHYISPDRRCIVLHFANRLACRIELWCANDIILPIASARVQQGRDVRAGEQLLILNATALGELIAVITFAPASAKLNLLPHYGRAIANEDVILSFFQHQPTEVYP